MDVARQRLTAIRQHNELGAGFRIAMRDLELRGAGNLLGPEQSGHIVGVGFDLYCQLLRQSVARLKGDKSARWVRATLKLDFLVFGSAGTQETGPSDPGFEALQAQELEAGRIPKVEARIPAEYIAETRLRLDFYRRLALADSARVLKELEAEMQDRFGKPPRPVKFLILATEIRCRAEQKGLQLIEAQGGKLKCLRASGRPDDYVMIGSRFPRLTEGTGLSRLREILVFITNLPDA
jgi:transcription-repair coupling factor (superfamily II helicase)